MATRTDDPHVIEHRLLELVYTTDAPITSAALAYFASCSFEDAEKVLDNLVARDRIQLEVGDDGTMTYVFPNRHKLAPRVEPVRARPMSNQLVTALPMRHASPLLAATLSLFIPGAGQLYTGNVLTAVLWFLLVGSAYMLILPGIILHVFCVVSAATSAQRLNSSLARLRLEAG